MDRDDYLVSAALLSRGQDAATLADGLAARFERALPTHVDVERAGWGKHKKLKTLKINLEPCRFRIEIDKHGPHAWIDQIVRGICLKSEHVDMDTWLDRLAATLTTEAANSVETRLAIEDALG